MELGIDPLTMGILKWDDVCKAKAHFKQRCELLELASERLSTFLTSKGIERFRANLLIIQGINNCLSTSLREEDFN